MVISRDNMIAKRVEYNNKVYNQSFEGHIEDGLKILFAYTNNKENIVQSFCNRWELDFISFCKNLFYAVALHDIGKLTKQFQENIKVGKKSGRYPHALFGIPILFEIPFDTFDGIPLPLLAVLGHHTQLYNHVYDNAKLSQKVSYLNQEIFSFINKVVPKLYSKLGFTQYFATNNFSIDKFNESTPTYIYDNFTKHLVNQQIDYPWRTKSIFTYFFSILQLCDDYSSAHFSEYIRQNSPNESQFDSVISDTSDFVFDISIDESGLKNKLFGNNSLYSFQEDLEKKPAENSFLFAPCGRGKTEAALLWAFKIKKQLNCDRIIFALPTQVTCNAMYSRLLEDYSFGEKNVGLFHGKSLIALKYHGFEFNEEQTSPEETDYKSYDILRDEVFKGNVFFKPITVTTIDHLAYALVHGFSQADFACGNMQNSVIIFDEVHYYELHTLNILLRLFDILRKMRIPHLLMTGTAPDFLMQELKDYSIIKDEEGLKFEPFTIAKNNSENILDSNKILESIQEDYKLGKNIFVILNQVEWAQSFYKGLKNHLQENEIDTSIILYHGRYIHKDRIRKEQEIKNKVKTKPCILITTQVIEISLNISSDVMYTTIAPPDAIGQRAGRLNRSGKHYQNDFKYELKLFNTEKHLPYEEKLLKETWKYFEDGTYTYMKIKEVCDKVYNSIKLRKDKNYLDFFIDNSLFGNHHAIVTFGDDEGRALKIRDDNYQQIDVVPSRVFDEAEEFVNKDKAFWAEYKVKIPFSKLIKEINEYGEKYHFRKHANYNILECEYDYDYEYGVRFDKVYQRFLFS